MYIYLLSIPIATILFLLLMSYFDDDAHLYHAIIFALVISSIWPFTILFIIYLRIMDGYTTKIKRE